MIGTERIEHALRVIGASQFVKGGQGALSANLLAPSDAGKSELVLAHKPHGGRVINDITSMVLQKVMVSQPTPTYIVIPDFNIAIAHKPAVAELAMAILLALIGEGITELNPGLQNEVRMVLRSIQRQKQKTGRTTGLRIGLLTAMTPEMFVGKRGKWRGTGLLRRLVPLNYAYKRSTQNRIQEAIRTGSDALAYVERELPRHTMRTIELPPESTQARELEALSEDVAARMSWTVGAHPDQKSDGHRRVVRGLTYAFTPHKVLRQLAKASALLNGRGCVDAADIDAVFDIAEFMRLDRPEEV